MKKIEKLTAAQTAKMAEYAKRFSEGGGLMPSPTLVKLAARANRNGTLRDANAQAEHIKDRAVYEPAEALERDRHADRVVIGMAVGTAVLSAYAIYLAALDIVWLYHVIAGVVYGP